MIKLQLTSEMVQFILNVLAVHPLPFKDVQPVISTLIEQANNQPKESETPKVELPKEEATESEVE
jgi:hypothetical protein